MAPFAKTEGGAGLSATIDRYASGSLTPRADQRICRSNPGPDHLARQSYGRVLLRRVADL